MSIWRDWINKANEELGFGERIWISAENKVHQKQLRRNLQTELDILAKVDPASGNTLQVVISGKDKRFWVVIERTAVNPFVAIKQTADGVYEKISVEKESERKRMARLMLKDGYSAEDIRDKMNLSVQEYTWVKQEEDDGKED
jgi:hypothetical protein